MAVEVAGRFNGLDHVGVTVADEEAAARFFEEHFGAVRLYEAGPFEDPRGSFMADALGLDNQLVLNLVMLKLGDTANLEFLEFSDPSGSDASGPPQLSQLGAEHLGMNIDDLDLARAYFEGVDDVTVFAGPNPIDDSQPIAGSNFVFVKTSFGLMLELVNYPDHMPYAGKTKARLFHPSRTR